MKILYLITKANWGGAQRYVFDLARAAKSEGFQVAVAYGSSGLLAQRLKEAQIPLVQIKALERDIGLFKELKAIKEIYELLLESQPDIVHLNSSKAGVLGALAAKKYRKTTKRPLKVVFTAHGWAFTEADRSKLFLFLSRLGHKKTVQLCDKTIAVSKKTKEEFAQISEKLMDKIEVIYNGIRPLRLLSKEVARQRLFQDSTIPIGSYQPWICSIGELHPNKGYDLALEALSELKWEDSRWQKVLFAIIGSGEQKTQLEDLIRKKDLGANVFLLGQKDKAPQYLPAFDFFFISSRKEGLPYVALEGAASGSLLISSDTGGLPELVQDKENGILFKARDKEAMKEALRKALALSSRQKEELKKAVLKTFKSEFTFSAMWAKTKKLYLSL
ncbi:MAG: glycosyltransferase [Candidatus Harrisonbacteria bacterium]|nr:glycosyltransferase [Candidatus Harrisonbacteria bacterium]